MSEVVYTEKWRLDVQRFQVAYAVTAATLAVLFICAAFSFWAYRVTQEHRETGFTPVHCVYDRADEETICER